MPRKSCNDLDMLIGERIRQQRTRWGASQMMLAEALGISYQQVQKYEVGTNKIAASTLFEIAHQLDVPICFFFDHPA